MSIRIEAVIYAVCAVFMLSACTAVLSPDETVTSTPVDSSALATAAAPTERIEIDDNTTLECGALEEGSHRLRIHHVEQASVAVEVEANGFVGELARVSRPTLTTTHIRLSPHFASVTTSVNGGESTTVTNTCKEN